MADAEMIVQERENKLTSNIYFIIGPYISVSAYISKMTKYISVSIYTSRSKFVQLNSAVFYNIYANY